MEHATIGHNRAPSDAEIMAEQFEERYKDLLDHVNDLVIRSAKAPKTIEDDKMADFFVSFSKDVSQTINKAEAIRVEEKAPYLEKGRIVDGWFKGVIESLQRVNQTMKRPLDDFLIRKARAEREAREAEAKRLREEAEAKAVAAAALEQANKATQSDREMVKAVRLEERAIEMEEAIQQAPMASGGAHRSISGVTASLRTTWLGEIENLEALDLNKLKGHFPADAIAKAVNSFVRAGGRQLEGVKIYEKSETVVR